MINFFGGRKGGEVCREGEVSEVYTDRHSCRVTFEDRSGLVSAELPVLTLFAGENKSYALPDIGDRVIVLSASNDLTAGGGYVIGSLYTGSIKPEENNQNIYSLQFSDEAKISYRRKSENDNRSEFKLHFSEGTELTFSNEETKFEFEIKFSDGAKISYNNDGEFEMKFKDGSTIEHDGQRGDLDFNIKGEINITASGEINIQSRSDINIQGSNIHLN